MTGQRSIYHYNTNSKIMQYKALVCLIGKETRKTRTKKNRWMWDCYALFLFFVVMRIIDPNNFTWWSIINAASDYGGGGSKIPLFIGFSLSQRTLHRHLSALCPYDKITWWTIATLSSLPFIIDFFIIPKSSVKESSREGGTRQTLLW